MRRAAVTVLIALARAELPVTSARLFDELLGDPELDPGQIAMLQKTLLDSGAVEKVERLIAHNVKLARTALAEAPLSRDALGQLGQGNDDGDSAQFQEMLKSFFQKQQPNVDPQQLDKFIKDFAGNIGTSGSNAFGEIGKDSNGQAVYFSVKYTTYDWVLQDVYNNLGKWVEDAAKQAGR